MSASEDGTVRIFDARKQGNATRVLSEHTEFNDAIYHPLTPNLIATVDGEGLALLIDVRKIGDESIASEIAVLQVRSIMSLVSFGCDSNLLWFRLVRHGHYRASSTF